MGNVSASTNPRLGQRGFLTKPQPPVMDYGPWTALLRLDMGTHFGERDKGYWELLLLWLVEGLMNRLVEFSQCLRSCKQIIEMGSSGHRKTYKVRDHFVDSSVGLLGTYQKERCEHDPVSKIQLPTREQTLRWMEREKIA